MKKIKKKLKKKIEKKIIPFFESRFAFFLDTWQLIALYGIRTTLRLAHISRRSLKSKSLINKRLKITAKKMAMETKIPGSSLKKGWLYHDFPLPEYRFISHRKNSIQRIRKIMKNVSVYKARILDIGCSSGGISLGLALAGAQKVIGIDYDPIAVELGSIAAKKYDINNVELRNEFLEKFKIPSVDIIVWLSQWMWMVKAHNLDYGKNLMFEIPQKSGACFMVFESAADDGKAAIPGTTQKDIENFLRESTPFMKILNIGPFQDRWRKSGQERMVFICSEPQLTWKGKEAVITRIDRETVIKKFEPQRLWAKSIETLCLQKLEAYPYFPNLLDEGDDWIKMEWAGYPVSNSHQLKHLSEIVLILDDLQIIHRDICPENLLYCNGQLSLIDFGWAIVDSLAPPIQAPEGLGRGFYDSDNCNDANAAAKVYDWMKKQV